MIEPIKWKDGKIVFIDQTELPAKLKYVACKDVDILCEAIKKLRIRGAPLIGVAVALGYALAAVNSKQNSWAGLKKDLAKAFQKLRVTRPTAVNLFWALDRMERALLRFVSVKNCTLTKCKRFVLKEALKILEEDKNMCIAIGKNGAKLIKNGDVILTHCNAGILATAGQGTALSIIYEAKKQGKRFKVYADETRPLMQGSRLTMWELMRNNIDATLICDNMAASVIKNKGVTKIIVGSDRIAANGDAANKIGTYGLAVLARHHGIPFYVAAPSSTIDKFIKTGEDIPIEERKAEEIIYAGSRQIAPIRAKVYNPAFDVTPHSLISGIITEKGIYEIKRFRGI
ncbi:MAG: S-methyl-5-thioribose-1-phosphate isomerase [Candidatus Omnitrophica bacterium CG_4_9_14_0_2_um_filter_42_8]|nr:MAG: S-methyl-5-thioribose-1-phosphate isomerase [Candidatus Omnitrophica bacterium CG_4_9_14_0_2_um_filter_42_8]